MPKVCGVFCGALLSVFGEVGVVFCVSNYDDLSFPAVACRFVSYGCGLIVAAGE